MVCFGLSKPVAHGATGRSAITGRWILWALVGWGFAGISMTGQFAASVHAKGSELGFVFAFNLTAVVILGVLIRSRGRSFRRKREIAAGAVNGCILVGVGVGILTAVRLFPAITFPVTVACPVLIVLVLGQFVYRERVDSMGWDACILGTLGLVGMALGRTLGG